MQKKYYKMGKKIEYKKAGLNIKREVERKIKRDSQKSPNFGLWACSKTKKLLNHIRLVGKYALIVAKLILATLMLINQNPVQKRGISDKCVFISFSWPSLKCWNKIVQKPGVLNIYTNHPGIEILSINITLLPNFIPRGGLVLPDFPGLFKKVKFQNGG